MNTRYKAGAGVLIAALFILADLSFLSAAGNAETPPDLRGAWKGTGEVYYPDAVKKIDTELNITEQDGWYFKGTRGWKLVDPPEKPLGYIMNTPVNEADEPFLGVVGFDGKSLTLVENGDLGTMKAVLAGEDKMEFLYYEPGEHPLVFRLVLTRERAGE